MRDGPRNLDESSDFWTRALVLLDFFSLWPATVGTRHGEKTYEN